MRGGTITIFSNGKTGTQKKLGYIVVRCWRYRARYDVTESVLGRKRRDISGRDDTIDIYLLNEAETFEGLLAEAKQYVNEDPKNRKILYGFYDNNWKVAKRALLDRESKRRQRARKKKGGKR